MSLAVAMPAITLATDPMLPRPAAIRAIQPEAPGVATLWMEFLEPTERAAFRFRPGQFNMIYLPGFGEVAISMSSNPEAPERIGHTIRYAGAVTRGIERLKVGDVIGLRGPYGNGWPDVPSGHNLILVGGGIGMAPLRPVIQSVLRRRKDYRRVLLLYGARTPADLLYTEEFARWEAGKIELQITVDRADESWRGQVGVVPQIFYRIKIDHRRTLVMTCGPEVMMRFTIYEALARRIPKQAVYLSMERNMKCAVGLCGHCQFGPYFVCKDGPVFCFAEVEPFFGKEDF